MAESLIGKWFYFCNCGPSCNCGFHVEQPSSCPCGEPAVRRRVLAEDELSIFVSKTGVDPSRVANELGNRRLRDANGKKLQAFPKHWQPPADVTLQYRGKTLHLSKQGNRCEVRIDDRLFTASQHEGHTGWMGYPCYVMFDSPEHYARTLVDDWDIIGDEARLCPPRHAHHAGGDNTHAHAQA